MKTEEQGRGGERNKHKTLVRHKSTKADDHDGALFVVEHVEDTTPMTHHTFLGQADALVQLLGHGHLALLVGLVREGKGGRERET